MKAAWRGQSSGRPVETGPKLIRKSRKQRGGVLSKHRVPAATANDFYIVKAHRNYQSKSVMARMAIKEKRRLGRANLPGHARRKCQQLCARSARSRGSPP